MLQMPIKKNENYFQGFIYQQLNQEIITQIFWLILGWKFPQVVLKDKKKQSPLPMRESFVKSQEVMLKIQEKLKNNFFKVFNIIPTPKDIQINKLIFLDVYVALNIICNTFCQQNYNLLPYFTKQFFFESINFILNSTTGFPLSFQNLEQKIHNYFDKTKFLNYVSDILMSKTFFNEQFDKNNLNLKEYNFNHEKYVLFDKNQKISQSKFIPEQHLEMQTKVLPNIKNQLIYQQQINKIKDLFKQQKERVSDKLYKNISPQVKEEIIKEDIQFQINLQEVLYEQQNYDALRNNFELVTEKISQSLFKVQQKNLIKNRSISDNLQDQNFGNQRHYSPLSSQKANKKKIPLFQERLREIVDYNIRKYNLSSKNDENNNNSIQYQKEKKSIDYKQQNDKFKIEKKIKNQNQKLSKKQIEINKWFQKQQNAEQQKLLAEKKLIQDPLELFKSVQKINQTLEQFSPQIEKNEPLFGKQKQQQIENKTKSITLNNSISPQYSIDKKPNFYQMKFVEKIKQIKAIKPYGIWKQEPQFM
ncbi:hypothetical protein PPERSA_02157 [Pseudocohnilembus persalinus]|uniref:Uncharacterized protein n=1 Tax=Pseudocohnilembus persalinus TaxID=266149 RepID=A0A0V0Q7F6_PSEPJ|nr:hypothetical protein PPERSA_02157 [Pseudocohnilembus persalinus]|eukprot:KRW98179.1 hypothetical protein PPERSA_02157 [Pseudocohnilembus persalinus]